MTQPRHDALAMNPTDGASSIPPPISMSSSHSASVAPENVELGYLASGPASELSSRRARPVSPLRPVSQMPEEKPDTLNTGLVDPELMGVSPVDLNALAVPNQMSTLARDTSASVSRSNTHPRQAARFNETPPQQPETSAPLQREESVNTAHEERFRWSLGNYMLGRTIGAGSMGKVKYGYCKTDGAKVAVKIVPRHTSVNGVMQQARERAKQGNALSGSDLEAALARARSKDASKEVRILREGSLQLLLQHPYVCRMRELIVHHNHYYLVFEHINGGQMLDYIISHGRLRERSARVFARQIGSALQYCHANNVVHRDLKIENILISKSGNIKIIDFGLSNLYSPHSHLSTFCGSLYFAAPELLSARVYTGPEVDVWSFGVVLFVLVCGKVPFDDQSMPALHARIKRGYVDYPSWLSPECRHLLSRMLVTNPAQRATLAEVLAHPWMMKGYEAQEPSYLVPRMPLRAEALDPNVIERMTGFDFGSSADIERRLAELLRSDAYLAVLAQHERGESVERAVPRSGPPTDSRTANRLSRQLSSMPYFRRRSRVVEPEEPSVSPPRPSLDPMYGYDPLISIYFLVQELRERELCGTVSYSSSDLLQRKTETTQDATANSAKAAETASAIAAESDLPLLPNAGPDTATQLASAPDAPNHVPTPPVEIPSPTVRQPEQSHMSPLATGAPLAVPPALTLPPQSMHEPTPVFESRQKSQPHGAMLGVPRPRAAANELESSLRSNLISEGCSWSPKLPPPPLPPPSLPQRSLSMSYSSRSRFDRKPALPSPLSLGVAVAPNAETSQLPLQSDVDSVSPVSNGTQLLRRFGTLSVRPSSRYEPESTENDTIPPSTPGEAPMSPAMAPVPASDAPVAQEKATSKPVFLKGLFSVQTTSRRPRVVIRRDLIRVLNLFGIQHHEIRGGFECTFRGSLDEPALAEPMRSATAPAMPVGDAPVDDGSSLVATGIGEIPIDRGDTAGVTVESPPRIDHSSSTAEAEVQFEVFVVKVPLLLGINGLQFRRVSGNPWQYQTLAKRILTELNL